MWCEDVYPCAEYGLVSINWRGLYLSRPEKSRTRPRLWRDASGEGRVSHLCYRVWSYNYRSRFCSFTEGTETCPGLEKAISCNRVYVSG